MILRVRWLICLIHGLLLCGLAAAPAKANAVPSWYDQSHAIFMPRSPHAEPVLEVRDLPVFWWNFLILDLTHEPTEQEWARLAERCTHFVQDGGSGVRAISCTFDLKLYLPLFEAWIKDQPIRGDFPSKSGFDARAALALTQASFTSQPEWLKILRQDPLNSVGALRQILERKENLKFEKHHGYYYDVESKRALVAVQLSFSPEQTLKARPVLTLLETFCQHAEVSDLCTRAAVLGPHASTLENEEQIRHDLQLVSLLGGVFLLAFGAIVCGTGRSKLLLLVPPLLVATVLAGLLTVVAFGSIHGLTLSFGPGIVGLSLHYGLQAAFNQGQTHRIWRANLYGILTTIAILAVVMFSRLPLLQQIMFFSSTGLALSFSFFYIFQHRYPKLFQVKPYQLRLPHSRFLSWIALALAVLALPLSFLHPPQFDIRQMNYEGSITRETGKWLYNHAGFRSPLLTFHEGSEVLEQAETEKVWAAGEHIRVENVAQFLPPLEVQEEHLRSWKRAFCPEPSLQLSAESTQFFAPFLESSNCAKLKPRNLNRPYAAYLQDFVGTSQWVTLWMPASDQEEATVRTRFPRATSVVELFSSFAQVLSAELKWMLPLAFFLSYLLLARFCHSWKLGAIALVPFFCGIGLFYLCATIGVWAITLISFIGIIKIFGFSLDYGIFVTDIFADPDSEHAHGVWTALNLNSLSTILGFLPLCFCGHPVLRQLGEALVCGSVGCYVGAMWGLMPFRKFGSKLSHNPTSAR